MQNLIFNEHTEDVTMTNLIFNNYSEERKKEFFLKSLGLGR